MTSSAHHFCHISCIGQHPLQHFPRPTSRYLISSLQCKSSVPCKSPPGAISIHNASPMHDHKRHYITCVCNLRKGSQVRNQWNRPVSRSSTFNPTTINHLHAVSHRITNTPRQQQRPYSSPVFSVIHDKVYSREKSVVHDGDKDVDWREVENHSKRRHRNYAAHHSNKNTRDDSLHQHHTHHHQSNHSSQHHNSVKSIESTTTHESVINSRSKQKSASDNDMMKYKEVLHQWLQEHDRLPNGRERTMLQKHIPLTRRTLNGLIFRTWDKLKHEGVITSEVREYISNWLSENDNKAPSVEQKKILREHLHISSRQLDSQLYYCRQNATAHGEINAKTKAVLQSWVETHRRKPSTEERNHLQEITGWSRSQLNQQIEYEFEKMQSSNNVKNSANRILRLWLMENHYRSPTSSERGFLEKQTNLSRRQLNKKLHYLMKKHEEIVARQELTENVLVGSAPPASVLSRSG